MTEFKKGDRVKVEFEGFANWVGDNFMGVTEDDGGRYHTVHRGSATLLERPVEPLAPGSVVRDARDGDVWVVQDGGRVHYVAGDAQFLSTHTATSLARKVSANPNYTLIHDGSKK